MATRDKLATANEKPTAKLTAKHDKLTAKQEELATVSNKLATLMAAPDTPAGAAPPRRAVHRYGLPQVPTLGRSI